MKKLFLIVFVAMNTLANAQNQIPANANDISPLLIGEKIPNFTLKSTEDTDVKVGDLLNDETQTPLIYHV